MPVERTGKLLCYRCLEPIEGGFLLDCVSTTPCNKCAQTLERESRSREKEEKRKAAEEAKRRKQEVIREAALKRKREREKQEYQKRVAARGGRLCPICGVELRPYLPELILDKKSGKQSFRKSWPSACTSCRAHGQEILRRLR